MIDIVDAKIVELLVDDTGKIWVNVDGACALRIGCAEHVIASCDGITIKFDAPKDES